MDYVLVLMGCYSSKAKKIPRYEDPVVLAAETPFTVSEVEAVHELYKKLSSSIYDDGLIHKGELQLALFRNQYKKNLFADRIFDLFDIKRNGVIEFGEFIRSLGVFHPNVPVEDKITFAFRLYDLRQTGFIEREELKEMVSALLHESELLLSDDVVEAIVDKTFRDADEKGDGRIDQQEWNFHCRHGDKCVYRWYNKQVGVKLCIKGQSCLSYGAPVTAWDGYDTFYTEKYMGIPSENEESYEWSSLMHHVHKMKGKLLLVHGMIDENVHFRHTARLVNALIAARKTYELLIFPDERHMPRRQSDRVYMEERIWEFIERNL